MFVCNHQLHLWEYDNEAGRFGKSNVILKTTKTIRTVHFHPLGAPMIMTTERIEPKPIQEGSEAVASRSPQVLGDLTLGAMAPMSTPWFPGNHDGAGHPTMPHQAAMVWNHPYAGPVIAPNNGASREILSLGNQMPQVGVVPPPPPPPPTPPPSMQEPNWWGHGRGMSPAHPHGTNGYFGSWPGPESHSGHFPSGETEMPPMQHPGMGLNMNSAGATWHNRNNLGRGQEDGAMSSSVIMKLARNFGGHRSNNRHFHRGERRYSHDMDMHSGRMPRRAAHRHQQSVDEMELRRADGWQHHTLSLGPNQGIDSLPPMQLPPWPERSDHQQRQRRRHQHTRHGSYGGHGSQDHAQMPIIPEISLMDRTPYGIPPSLANLPVANVPLVNVPYGSLELQRTVGPSEVPVITHTTLSRIGQIFASFSSFNSQDLPCTTKLTLWKFEVDEPHKYLDQPVMQIPGTVLCSEMGAHMSPCGRLLAICTAALGSVPSFGPDSVHYSYELKVISLESETFGEIIRSRPISAGHCLTSVQFSPGSDMILLSYGRKHRSLVRELVSRGQTVAKIHTLLEVYRASDLSLERVLHSMEDEANTACFHPFPGEGIFYGTKGGKLRILRHTQSTSTDADDGDSSKFEDELLEVDELEDSTALGIEGASS